MNRSRSIREKAYFFVFSSYLIIKLLGITMLYAYIPAFLSPVFMLASGILVILTFITEHKVSRTKFFWVIIVMMAAMTTGLLSGYKEIITTFFMILAAEGIKMQKIVRRYCFIMGGVILFTLLCVRVGLISDVIWNVSWDNLVASTKRHGMGFIYPTDFVSCVFYLMCGIVYLKQNEKFSIWLLLLIIGVALATYYYCLTRLDSGCILLLAAAYVYLALSRKNTIGKVLKWTALAIIPVCVFLSIWTAVAFNPSNPRWVAMNYVLSNRLYYGHQGVVRYGFSLLGQNIFMRGNSVLSANVKADYFYLDSSYLNIALRYGMICLFAVCGICMYQCYRHVAINNRMYTIIFMLISINSLIAHHLFDGYTNVFIFAALADISFESKAARRKRLVWNSRAQSGPGSRAINKAATT